MPCFFLPNNAVNVCAKPNKLFFNFILKGLFVNILCRHKEYSTKGLQQFAFLSIIATATTNMKGKYELPLSHLLGRKIRHKGHRHISYKIVAFISSVCQLCASRVRDVRSHMLVLEDRSLRSGKIPDIIERITDFENQILTVNPLPVL